MKLYLAGPINGCTDQEANGWRSAVKQLHPDCLDPMDRDYRGVEDANVADIVEKDKQDIFSSDVVLVYFEKPSVGTSMEVLFAWERGIPVVIINKSGKGLSPWLQYHAVAEFLSVEQAIKFASLCQNSASTRDILKRIRLDQHHVGEVLR
jgi:nucleoside 2-deoxyribosyltransferase